MAECKLTISILISLNYDGVKKCLESIEPLRQQVDSELILTDTGCGTKVRALIEEYADKIIDFEWIKDFSAARNVGLKMARGEWFLYIDDDEYFDDVSELVRFFNSDESKKANVATYIQRNYYTLEGSEYVDHIVDRILRINPALHFEHRIHEAYTDIDIGKKVRLNAVAHHYGYAYTNDEERLKKSKRNRELLIMECEEHPSDMRMRFQLVIDHYGLKEYDDAIRVALAGINIKSDSQYWDALHTELLYCYECKSDWDSVIKYGEEFLHHNLFPNDEFGVRQYLINAYYNNKKYEKVCSLAPICIDTYLDHKKHPGKYDANQIMREEFFWRSTLAKMFLYIAISSVMCEDVGVFDKVLSAIKVVDMPLDEYVDAVDNCFPLIPVSKIDVYINWVRSWIEADIAKACYLEAKYSDYRLRSIEIATIDMDEYESLEYALGHMTSYADNMIKYCEGKYGDAFFKMGDDKLTEAELLAVKIMELIDSVDRGDISSATAVVRDIAKTASYWAKAVYYLPMYIQLVLGGRDGQ